MLAAFDALLQSNVLGGSLDPQVRYPINVLLNHVGVRLGEGGMGPWGWR